MKYCFSESVGQKCGCALHMGAHYRLQNRVPLPAQEAGGVWKLQLQMSVPGCSHLCCLGSGSLHQGCCLQNHHAISFSFCIGKIGSSCYLLAPYLFVL